MATKTKECRRKTCLKTKPITDFPSDAREKDGHSVWCKPCWSEYQAARKALKAGGKPGKPAKTTKPASKSTKATTKPVAKTSGKSAVKQVSKTVKPVAKSARAIKSDPEVS